MKQPRFGSSPAYPPDTAGGRMTPAFVAISPDVRADDAIVLLRRVAEEAETIYYVYVIDAEEHLLGVLSLHNLVLTRPHAPVSAVMVADPIRVRADADQETAANLLVDKNLLALPVVDDRDHLLGIITPGRRRRRPRGGDHRGLRAHRWLPATRRAVPVRLSGTAGASANRLAAYPLRRRTLHQSGAGVITPTGCKAFRH